MKSAAASIVLITGSRVCRIDAGGGLWSGARPSGQALAESVVAALALGDGGAGRQVVVLTTEVWTQTLSLPRGQVSGLSKQQVEQALVFEAEPYSGLPALESVLGAVDSGARDNNASFWVVQTTRTERDAIQQAVKSCGHKFLGLGHPGGMPVPLGSLAAGHAWCRVEAWDGAWLLLSCDDGRHGQVKVLPAVPTSRDLLGHGAGAIERLHARSSSPVFEPGALNLADESTLRTWGTQATEVLLRRPEAVPLIAPAVPPRSAAGPVLVGSVLGAAVLFYVIGQMVMLNVQKNRAEALLAESARVTPLIESTKKAATGLKTEKAALEKTEKVLETVERQRELLPLFLGKLAELTSEDLVVRSIKPERGGMLLGGVALEAAAVDELGLLLKAALHPVRYVAQPVEKKARHTFGSRGPWDFTLGVVPEDSLQRNLVPELIDN